MNLFGGFVLADLQSLALVTQPPVRLCSPFAFFQDQPVGRSQLVNAVDHRVRRGHELVLQVLPQGEQIDASFDLRVNDQRLQFG